MHKRYECTYKFYALKGLFRRKIFLGSSSYLVWVHSDNGKLEVEVFEDKIRRGKKNHYKEAKIVDFNWEFLEELDDVSYTLWFL